MRVPFFVTWPALRSRARSPSQTRGRQYSRQYSSHGPGRSMASWVALPPVSRTHAYGGFSSPRGSQNVSKTSRTVSVSLRCICFDGWGPKRLCRASPPHRFRGGVSMRDGMDSPRIEVLLQSAGWTDSSACVSCVSRRGCRSGCGRAHRLPALASTVGRRSGRSGGSGVRGGEGKRQGLELVDQIQGRPTRLDVARVTLDMWLGLPKSSSIRP